MSHGLPVKVRLMARSAACCATLNASPTMKRDHLQSRGPLLRSVAGSNRRLPLPPQRDLAVLCCRGGSHEVRRRGIPRPLGLRKPPLRALELTPQPAMVVALLYSPLQHVSSCIVACTRWRMVIA